MNTNTALRVGALKWSHLLAVVTLNVVGTTVASAAFVFTYLDGDVILGARKSGAANNIEFNLGPASQFYNAAPGSSFSVGNGALLKSAFNNDLTSIRWSVSGTIKTVAGSDPQHPVNTLWLSRARSDIGIQSTPWQTQTTSSQGTTGSKIQSIGNTAVTYGLGNPSAVVGNNVILIPGDSSSSYARWAGSGSAGFGATANFNQTFQGDAELQVPNSFSSGSVRADFYQLVPASSQATRGAAAYLGYFNMESTGDLRFFAAGTAVPEPGEVAAMAGIGLLAFGAYRRLRR